MTSINAGSTYVAELADEAEDILAGYGRIQERLNQMQDRQDRIDAALDRFESGERRREQLERQAQRQRRIRRLENSRARDLGRDR